MIDEKWLKVVTYGIPSFVLGTWSILAYRAGDQGPISKDTIGGWYAGNKPWTIQAVAAFAYLFLLKRRVDRG